MSERNQNTRKVEQVEKGYEVLIESKRGTGTRDQDKVRIKAKVEEKPDGEFIESLLNDVKSMMGQRRSHITDGESQ